MTDISSASYVVQVLTNREDSRLPSESQVGTSRSVSTLEITERVKKFTYEDVEDKQDVLKLVIDNSDLIYFDNPVLVHGNLIRFYFGYPGKIFGPRIHVIDSIKGFEELTVTAVSEDAAVNEAKCNIFKNLTRAEVVRKVFADQDFIRVSRLVIDEDNMEDKSKKDWTQGRQTNWQFLQRLAEKISYEVYIEDDTLFFVPRPLSSAPVRRFRYYTGNGDLKKFDITEWKTSDRASKIEVKGYDPVEREEVSHVGSNSATSRDTLGSKNSLNASIASVAFVRDPVTGAVSKKTVGGKKILTSPEKTQDSIGQEANTHYKRSEQMEMKATAKIVGDPLLRAKSTIIIEGISKVLSGTYYITSHIHELGEGQVYEGSLKLLTDAFSASPDTDTDGDLDKGKAKENKKDVSDQRQISYIRDPVTGQIRRVD